jgi:AraC-like DNA-binding protein
MIASAGRELRDEPSYHWDGLNRTKAGVAFALLQHTFAGRGRLEYQGRSMVVEPGHTMLLCFPHDNRYWVEPGDAWSFFYLCVHGREIMRLWSEAVDRLGPVAQLEQPTLETAAQACTTAIEREWRGPGHVSALAYAVAAALYDQATSNLTPTRRSPAIQAAIDLAQGHLAQPLGVEQLAQAAGYSRWHFTRLFKQSEGVSPAAYLLSLRMKRAAHLLQSTDLPVKQIAGRCGFADPNYFAKAFSHTYHVSPSEFRHSGMYRQRAV